MLRVLVRGILLTICFLWPALAQESTQWKTEESTLEYDFDGITASLDLTSVMEDPTKEISTSVLLLTCSEEELTIGLVTSYTTDWYKEGSFPDQTIGTISIAGETLTGTWEHGTFISMHSKDSSIFNNAIFDVDDFFRIVMSLYKTHSDIIHIKLLFPDGTDPFSAEYVAYVKPNFPEEMQHTVGRFHQLCSIWWDPKSGS
jgi:hypothetical protein